MKLAVVREAVAGRLCVGGSAVRHCQHGGTMLAWKARANADSQNAKQAEKGEERKAEGGESGERRTQNGEPGSQSQKTIQGSPSRDDIWGWAIGPERVQVSRETRIEAAASSEQRASSALGMAVPIACTFGALCCVCGRRGRSVWGN